MKIYHKSGSGCKRTPFVCVLASVLLTGILYSATFGTVHSHGNVLSKISSNVSAGFTEQVTTLSKAPFHGRSDGTECLICVLHRQFFSSIVNAPHFIVKASAQIARVSATTVFYRSSTVVSNPIARLSGRAPPLRRA
jgi:hypothetical protein